MSHELRTPPNSVIGFSELLQDQRVGPPSERQLRYAGHIHNGGQHLLQLISDILDPSKVEAGKLALQPELIPVATALEDILVIARGLAHKKAQELQADIAPDLPILHADPVRFKQIRFNPLSNAVKFPPERGRITVTAKAVRAIADHPGGTRLQNADWKGPDAALQSEIANLKLAIVGFRVKRNRHCSTPRH